VNKKCVKNQTRVRNSLFFRIVYTLQMRSAEFLCASCDRTFDKRHDRKTEIAEGDLLPSGAA